jgi:hypothetical protein
MCIDVNATINEEHHKVHDNIVKEIPNYFTTDDLYIICTNSIPESVVMNSLQTSHSQIPFITYDLDWTAVKPHSKMLPIKTVELGSKKDRKGIFVDDIITLEKGIAFNEAELFLRIMILVQQLYPQEDANNAKQKKNANQ